MTTVYLIGVDHEVQYTNNGMGRTKSNIVYLFTNHLRDCVERLAVGLIAEEYSEEALRAYKPTVQNIARNLSIDHRFCDPDSNERKKHGIGNKEYQMRMYYWFDCIRDSLDKNILFICGDNHIQDFKEILVNNGLHSEIISRSWGKDLHPSDD